MENKNLEAMKLKASLYSDARFNILNKLEESLNEAKNYLTESPNNRYFIGECNLTESVINLVAQYLDALIDTAVCDTMQSIYKENGTNE